MARILHQLPFFEIPTTVTVPHGRLAVKPYQILVWVSLTNIQQEVPEPNIPRFPALLDTGLSHNFAIREEELVLWAGLDPRFLPLVGHVRLNRTPAHLLEANVWLYANRSGQRELLANRPPCSLELDSGIIVFPRGTPNAPRLPLLGLRGLRRAGLYLSVNCRTCRVSLRTPWWFWLFG